MVELSREREKRLKKRMREREREREDEGERKRVSGGRKGGESKREKHKKRVTMQKTLHPVARSG